MSRATTKYDNPRARMEWLATLQPIPELIAGWKITAEQWARVPAGDPNSGAYLLTLGVMERELLGRGIVLCEACGGPAGQHMPNTDEDINCTVTEPAGDTVTVVPDGAPAPTYGDGS